jgi:polyhydroxyalkanoate synthesis regulator phasin
VAERGRGTEAADAVRTAVDRTYQATVGQADVTRERAQEIVDELTQAASRVRSTLAELRVPTREELRALQDELAALERRVAKLERAREAGAQAAPKRPARKKPTTKGG